MGQFRKSRSSSITSQKSITSQIGPASAVGAVKISPQGLDTDVGTPLYVGTVDADADVPKVSR